MKKYTSKITTFLSFILLFAIQGFSQQGNQSIDLSSIYRPVGKTINAFNTIIGDYSNMKSPFVSQPENIGNPSLTFDIFLMDNTEQFYKSFGMDISAGGHFLFAKAKTDFSISTTTSSSSSTIRLCFSVNLNYGLQSMTGLEMTQEAKDLIKSDPQKFVDTYGDYYVSDENLVRKLFVFIDVDCSDGSQKNVLNTGVSGGINVSGIGDASINASARQIINTSYSNKKCHISWNSLGLFPNNILSNLLTSLSNDMQSQKDKFDLIQSLIDNLSKTLNQDADKRDIPFYHESPTYSNFISLGLAKGYYITFQDKIDKILVMYRADSNLTVCQFELNFYLNSSPWKFFLPENDYNRLSKAFSQCGVLKDNVLKGLITCQQNCKNIQGCCTLNDSIRIAINTINDLLNEMGRTYTYEPILIKSFGVESQINVNPVVIGNGLKKWTVEYRNPEQQNEDNLVFRPLDKKRVGINVQFSSYIYIPNYTGDLNSFKITGKVYDFTTNKEIPTHALYNTLSFIYTGYNTIRIYGTYPFNDPNIIYSKDNIGFILEIAETSPLKNVDKLSLSPWINPFGIPEPTQQGLYFYLN